MKDKKSDMKGLSTEEAKKLQEVYGKNILSQIKKETFFKKIIHVMSEPMFLLLIIAAIIYFILGEPRDGITMLIFVAGIISIDIIQEWKTDRTLNALKQLSAPKISVIRDNVIKEINSEDLVPGDLMMIYEGIKIPADGLIIKCTGLCINESTLTGEAEGVWKQTFNDIKQTDSYWKKDYCYAGTLVIQGSATVLVDEIGNKTEYGKISEHVANAKSEDTPLQKQTRSLVRTCAWIAGILFIFVAVITYLNIPDHNLKDRIIESILSGITLAMAMIPEEFPVILTVFLSMGAWRLAKKKSLVKRLASVETLGSISVLCVDKTGTITKNEMAVEKIWAIDSLEQSVCEIMGLACCEEPYDPMEKAMLEYCKKLGIIKKHLFNGVKIKEYAFSNEAKMMGYIWERNDINILVAKGSPESIIEICNFESNQKEQVEHQIRIMSRHGLRVIGVAKKVMSQSDSIFENLNNYTLEFCGLVGLMDPPREAIKNDIEICHKAGIRVVMITGDNGITASSIAEKIGMPHNDDVITGEMLNKMSDEQLCEKVKDINIFSRVIPEHKMRIIKAFRKNGEVVAMTGDGVNDAPALKYADIGIAMGKRGSEVSREAANLILMDDNFSTIVDTVRDGRRIYDNICKAVGYIFVIHIPIALSSLCAPLLGINPINLFLLPIHVVLLELIIDPTCSIVLERQPAEENIMARKPRNPNSKLVTVKGLLKSVIQGLIIFLASFVTYYIMLNKGNVLAARSMGLVIIMLANLFLVQVNSSNTDYAFNVIKKLIKDKVMWTVNIITIVGVLIILYSPLNNYLKLAPLTINQLLIVVVIAFVSVFWYEIVKLVKNLNNNYGKLK